MKQEYVEKKYGFNLMKESILQIAKQLNQLQQKAYDVYFSLFKDVCEQEVLEDELSHLLDYLLDFACDEKILVLFKKVCRKYLQTVPSFIKFYFEAYWEIREDDNDCQKEFLTENRC